MKILIVGATGFIGSAIYQGLKLAGHEVIAGIRNPEAFEDKAIKIDFSSLKDDINLVQKLQDIDIVINAVGIISPKNGQSFKQMHTSAPIMLFDAAKKAHVKRIIQISALGTKDGTTLYHTSKHKADSYLKSLSIDYAILYPSVVYGDDGKSTALFQSLASLPMVPIIKDGSQIIQPIDIKDLVQTVIKIVPSNEKNIELNLVGEKSITYKALLLGFRKYLGLKNTKTISLPTIGTNIIGKILDEPTINHDNIIMLNQGNSADVKPLSDFLGYTPTSIEDNLFQKRANNAQKLFASLYLIRPTLRIVIGFVWIWSGIVSAFLYPQIDALKLLHEVGVSAPLDLPLLYISAFLDITIGIITLMGYKLKPMLLFQIIVILVYTIILTFMAPYHWLHPFGPLLKNIPLVVTIYILLQLERYR
ncbi:MAG: SDR family oxidoreductase [Sulfurovum sp.]|nr:SDR family oxidoreductase [Sulfurovum sp.]